MTTAQARRRRARITEGAAILSVALIAIAIAAQFFINSRLAGLIEVNRESAAQAHLNQIHACQLSNQHLREVVNRNIVRPLSDALTTASQLNPKSFARIADELATVPYARCHHLYPTSGTPMRPFFRQAPLPAPRHVRRHHKASPATPSSPQSDAGSAAVGTTSSAPSLPAPPPTGTGGGGGNPSPNPPPSGNPGNPSPPPTNPPPSNSPPPNPLDPVTKPVCGLTGVCIKTPLPLGG